jgi:hypothetical protein
MEPLWLAYLREHAPDMAEQAAKDLNATSESARVTMLEEAIGGWQRAHAEDQETIAFLHKTLVELRDSINGTLRVHTMSNET